MFSRTILFSLGLPLLCFVLFTKSDCPSNSPELRLNNGRFMIHPKQSSHTKNTIAVAICKRGYKRHGDMVLICDGKRWSTRTGKKTPSCQEPQCPEPPALKNGYFVFNTSSSRHKFAAGSLVYYRCLDGFNKIGGTRYMLCLRLRLRWKGTLPKCRPKMMCKDLEKLEFGNQNSYNRLEGSKIVYRCNDNHKMIGNARLTCLHTGKWDKPKPVCKPSTSCPVPTQKEIPHSVISADNPKTMFALPGEYIFVECQKGFRLQGINLNECLENGRWDSQFATCVAVDGCPAIKEPSNGGIVEKLATKRNSKIGTTVNFYCNDTYRLTGSSWLDCIYDEFLGIAWSSDTPRCQATQCSDHSRPDNGNKFPESGPYHVRSVVTYSCYEGYTLIGSKNRTCKDTGTWSGVLTTCDSQNSVCPDPGQPINGFKSGSRYNARDVVTYTCKPGYFLQGNGTRICLENGYWSGTEVFCRGPDEFDDISLTSTKLLTQIDTLKLIAEQKSLNSSRRDGKDANNTGSGRTLDLNNPGGLNLIFIFDSSGSVGKRGFDIAKKFAIALVQHVGVRPDGVQVAAITFNSKVTVNFYTGEFTTTDKVVNQLNMIRYEPGDTATNPALYTAKSDVIPLATKLRPTSSTAIFLITDGRANVGGNPNGEAKEIVQQFDAEIYAIGVGNKILEDELANIAYPKGVGPEQHYLKVESFAKMNEMLQFLVNGTIDYSACGLLQRRLKSDENAEEVPEEGQGRRKKRSYRIRIIGGEDVTKHWPWMAALYYGNEQAGFTSLRCGGSLIGRNWVMTAAHCWRYKSQNNKIVSFNTNEVRIHLGITNINEPEWSSLIRAVPDQIIIHPKYNVNILNNDIALIRLRDFIRYNALVRPVCLPPPIAKIPKESLLYKNGETAWVTGWGHTKKSEKLENVGLDNLKQSKVLQKLAVPLRNGKLCEASLKHEFKKTNFTDSMICAGDGKGGKDSCTTDSGGPLHQKREDENGDGATYYTQIGIVSWGLGCALEGEYGFYTKVSKFVPWIEQETKLKFS